MLNDGQGNSFQDLKVKFFNRHFATKEKLEKEVNDFIATSVDKIYGIETNFYNDEILVSLYYKEPAGE